MQADKSTDSSVARAAACGKINLTLEIKGLREDGFHDLRSLAIGVDLFDQISCKANPGRGLHLSCSDPSLSSAGNLVWQAAELLASRYDLAPDVEIELIKSIPVGAGMGGGSSDAATALQLCNDLWRVGVDRSSLASLGADLGSDVPLFFSLPSAVITGRGEHVEPVTMHWSGWVVLVFAGVAVSTAEVYRAWRREDARDMPSGLDADIACAESATEFASLLSNHLEPAVFRVSPVVADVYDKLNKLQVCPVRVSGAGSALYMLFDEFDTAQEAARLIRNRNIGVETIVARAPVDTPPIVREEHTDGDFGRTREIG